MFGIHYILLLLFTTQLQAATKFKPPKWLPWWFSGKKLACQCRVSSLGWEDPLEKEIATHSSVLAWQIPMDRGAWWAIVHGVPRESDMTYWLNNKLPQSRFRHKENTGKSVKIFFVPQIFSSYYFTHHHWMVVWKLPYYWIQRPKLPFNSLNLKRGEWQNQSPWIWRDNCMFS